jgi:hypothetical protein
MAGEIFAVSASCCSFCSGESWEAREFFSMRCEATSRQSTRWFSEKLTAKLSRVRTTIGGSHEGLRTISWKVAFGEKNTPKIREIALKEGCAGSGLGAGGATTVDIEDSSTTG